MAAIGLLKVLVKLRQKLQLLARRFGGKDRQQGSIFAAHKTLPRVTRSGDWLPPGGNG